MIHIRECYEIVKKKSCYDCKKIVDRFYYNQTPDRDDEFIFTEELRLLIEAEHDPKDMIHLGGHYYGAKRYDKAL